jgi:hypothetical protein
LIETLTKLSKFANLHICQNKKVGKCEKELFSTSKSAFGTSKQCAAVRTNFL